MILCFTEILHTMASITMSNGNRMPQIQLGTFRTRGPDVAVAVTAAIKCGYRGIDTAAVYRNHKDIADTLDIVLPQHSLRRENIFITSKLSPKDQGMEQCKEAVNKALVELRTDYLDLFLIHWPGVQKLPVDHPDNRTMRLESWKAMEEMYTAGLLKSIGVSNFTVEHLEDLIQHSSIVPHVNQVELHPHFPQKHLVEYCTGKNIHLQAYSSLGQNGVNSELLNSKPVSEIAQRIDKTSAQVLLRWGVQQGYTVLPKSTNPEHIESNFNLDFRLSECDMKMLNELHRTESKKYAWNPEGVL